MAKLIIRYIPEDDYKDNMTIQYELTKSSHISVIHRLMKQAVAAMGYTEKNIEAYFGPTCFD